MLAVSKHWCKQSRCDLDSAHCGVSSDTSPRIPTRAFPSTCRLPLCRWVYRSRRPKPSVPDASESVRWGPASRSASAGGLSWWCLSVPGCRPPPPQRSASPWDQRGLGCGRPLGRPGTARTGSVGVGMDAGWSRAPPRRCLVFPPRPHRRRDGCDRRVESKKCEGESGSGCVRRGGGH